MNQEGEGGNDDVAMVEEEAGEKAESSLTNKKESAIVKDSKS